MGIFRVENGIITIDDGEKAVSIAVADVEKAAPWLPDLPARMLYDQADERARPKLDAAIAAIDKIQKVVSDRYHGLAIEAARSLRKKEIIGMIAEEMMMPQRLFGVILPAVAGDASARTTLAGMLARLKASHIAAEAAIDAAESVDDIKQVGIMLE